MQFKGYEVLATKLGYTKQNAFAKRVDVFPSEINAYWRPSSTRRPSLPTLERMAERLDMSILELISVLYGEATT